MRLRWSLPWSRRGSAPRGDADYLALLDRYLGGELTEAATALAAWPEGRVRSAVQSSSSQLSLSQIRAAVMLHTESAFEADDDGGLFHLDVSRSFLRRLLDSQKSAPAAKDFAARWHALIAMLYCTRQEAPRARYEINRGLQLDGDHKYVNLVANALLESEVPNRNDAFSQARQGYRFIIAKHPDFYEARLRLGWSLLQNHSLQNAREQLEIVAARAMNADVLYLAHLFLAAVHERANRAPDAEREYEAARAVAPYPSSLVSLIRIAAMRGQDERVRSLAAEISTMETAGREDPWISYTLCVTAGDLFEGMRLDARRQ